MSVFRAALLPLAGVLAVILLLLVPEQVPASGWRLWLDLCLVGFAAGALLHGLIQRALGRGWPRRLLGVAALALVFGLGHLRLAPSQPAVIVIVVDCLSADRLSPELMPRTLAAVGDGYRFADGRAQSSWTRSSTPSLLTGRYPVEHGLYRLEPQPDRLRPGVQTLAQAFDDAGWATAAFANQAQLDPAFGLSAGFHRYGFRDGPAPVLQAHFLRWHRFFRLVPRFVYLHYLDIHKPFLPDPAFLPAELPDSDLDLGPASDWAGFMRAVNQGERTLRPADWRYLEALHEAEIRQLDQQLGAMLEGLRADGTLDRAWLLLTSDHGEAFGEHGFFTHGELPYEELLQIPVLLRPPGGLGAPVPVEATFEHVDVAPTLLAHAGLPGLPGASGRVVGEASLPERPGFAEFYAHEEHVLAVRWQRWKYLRQGEGELLFDLERDPGEQRDLAGERPERLRELRNIGAWYLAGEEPGEADWAELAGRDRAWPQVGGGEAARPEEGSMEALRALGYVH